MKEKKPNLFDPINCKTEDGMFNEIMKRLGTTNIDEAYKKLDTEGKKITDKVTIKQLIKAKRGKNGIF